MLVLMNKLMCLYVLLFCVAKQIILCYSEKAEIVNKWVKLDYEWQSDNESNYTFNNKTFIPENNLITGIKIYRKRVFVTVPRWRLGIPATLNEVVRTSTGEHILRPFPSWNFQDIGNCSAFQYVQSMEVDPNTGYMWIIDTGSINTASTSGNRQALCAAKLVIYDINEGQLVRSHNFPESVVSRDTNFLNDIVIDYKDGKAGYAYITDAGSVPKIVVYDFERDESYYFQHETMESKKTLLIYQSGKTFSTDTPLDGIAISPDFSLVFYSTITGKEMYAIPTDVLRNRDGNFSTNVIEAGIKMSRSDGLVFSQNALYMSSLTSGSVYRRSITDLISVQNDTELFHSNEQDMKWVDTFAIDEEGNLWFTVNNINLFFSGAMNFSDSAEENMFIWKAAINEPSYLADAPTRTTPNAAATVLSENKLLLMLMAAIVLLKSNSLTR